MKPPPFVLGLAALLLAGCGGGRGAASPTAPTATLSLTGTWRGTVSDNSGTAEVTVRLTHSGNDLEGTVSMVSADGRFTGEGAVAVGHAGWHLRKELMAEHAEMIAAKMAEKMGSGKR